MHDLSLDHIVPLAEGGKSNSDNLQTLCKKCNCAKGVNTIDYRHEKIFETVIRAVRTIPEPIEKRMKRRNLEIDSMKILSGRPGDTLILDFVFRKKPQFTLDDHIDAFNKAETRTV